MTDAPRSTHGRRRSSIMYDPARDAQIELLDPVNESVTNRPHKSAENDHAAHSLKHSRNSPSMEPKEIKKRRWSVSPGPQTGTTSSVQASPLPKKPQSLRTDDEIKKQGNFSQHLPRGPSDKRSPYKPTDHSNSHNDSLRHHDQPGSSASRSRIPPMPINNRRPDAERPRQNDYHRAPPHRRSRSRSPAGRRSPPSAYRRRDPPPRPPPRSRTRSPSPIRASPPREQVRPGGARGRGRNVLAEQQRLAEQREREANAHQKLRVQEASNRFYNERPNWVKEKGREWRKNESEIKGLRSFNNWIKSVVIQRFSPEEKADQEEVGWGETAKEPEAQKPLLVLDIGCGKGGDLGKWQLAPQTVGLYVGLDPAATSIQQANERYSQMRRGRRPVFDATFAAKDCFGEWIGDIPIVAEVGIDPSAGQPGSGRWTSGGFDVVSMMFSMHYAFESEERVRTMLRNVSGSLKKGGRFIGVVPNSDSLSVRIRDWYIARGPGPNTDPETNPDTNPDTNSDPAAPVPGPDPESPTEAPSWGNSIYNVRFPQPAVKPYVTTADGGFRPPFGWKYTYWMAEAVDVPEFVVPWEAFRAVAETYNLEQRYRRPFLDIWAAEKDDAELGPLAQRMGVVRERGGPLEMSADEREAVAFYHAFCFVKV